MDYTNFFSLTYTVCILQDWTFFVYSVMAHERETFISLQHLHLLVLNNMSYFRIILLPQLKLKEQALYACIIPLPGKLEDLFKPQCVIPW